MASTPREPGKWSCWEKGGMKLTSGAALVLEVVRDLTGERSLSVWGKQRREKTPIPETTGSQNQLLFWEVVLAASHVPRGD